MSDRGGRFDSFARLLLLAAGLGLIYGSTISMNTELKAIKSELAALRSSLTGDTK